MTGKRVTVKGVVGDQLALGTMTKSRILMDTMGMVQQLGVIPHVACLTGKRSRCCIHC